MSDLSATSLNADHVLDAIEHGDYIADSDSWSNETRAADVSRAYLRAVALGVAVIAAELREITMATYRAGGV